VPTGTYTLRVAGVARGSFDVVPVAGGSNGEIEFRSPVEPGKRLLDFDPRGQRIEVVRNGTVFLSTDLATTTPPPGDGGPTGSGEYVLVVEPAGNDGPELHAELELRAGRAEFSVEVEDVAAGAYTLRVDGVERGTVQVVAVPGGTSSLLRIAPSATHRAPYETRFKAEHGAEAPAIPSFRRTYPVDRRLTSARATTTPPDRRCG